MAQRIRHWRAEPGAAGSRPRGRCRSSDGLKGVARLSRQRFHRVECVDSGLGGSRWSWEHPLEPGGCSSHVSWIQDVVCCWPYPCAGKNASAGNRTRVTSMATMYSTTRPLMLLGHFWHRVYIIVFVLFRSFPRGYSFGAEANKRGSEIQAARCHEKQTLDGFLGRLCYIRGVLIDHHLVSWPNG